MNEKKNCSSLCGILSNCTCAIYPVLILHPEGAIAALDRGLKIGGNIINTQIVLHNLQICRGTADSFLMSAATQCVQKILLKCGLRLLELIMSIEIVAPPERMSQILTDLTKRRGTILDVESRGEFNKVVAALAPLAELRRIDFFVDLVYTNEVIIHFSNVNPVALLHTFRNIKNAVNFSV